MESDEEYFARRAREEKVAAACATSPEAKATHQQLSTKFHALALQAKAAPSD